MLYISNCEVMKLGNENQENISDIIDKVKCKSYKQSRLNKTKFIENKTTFCASLLETGISIFFFSFLINHPSRPLNSHKKNL